MKHETSAGGIVFRKDIMNDLRSKSSKDKINKLQSGLPKAQAKHEIKILMIKDQTDKWVFPKGLVDKGETKEQAAIREVKEETGLEHVKIIAPLGQIKFFYKWEGETIFKIVYFFLMETDQEDLKHQREEIKDAAWIDMNSVLEKNSYKNQEEIIKKALEKIKQLMKKNTLKDF
jgi:8-oxo-dGTP diphosphatase